jgi:hypothetical protein
VGHQDGLSRALPSVIHVPRSAAASISFSSTLITTPTGVTLEITANTQVAGRPEPRLAVLVAKL